MGRPKNSKVRHGMASCAHYGCRLPECCEAEVRARRSRCADLRKGHRATVPAGEARAHGLLLVEAGVPPVDIAEWAGLGRVTVADVLQGRVTNIYRTTAEAILFLPIPDEGYRAKGEARVDALPSRRRLRALGALGFPVLSLAREVKVSHATIRDVREGFCQRVKLTTHVATRKTYDALWNVNPLDHGVTRSSFTMTRARAVSEGWPPPAAWDDDEIGNPQASPAGYRVIGGRRVWDLPF